jgi:hypothetical protein
MKAFVAAVVSGWVLACAPEAMAASFTPLPGQSYSLDLDTADGNFSAWRAADLQAANALRAKVTFARLGSHKRWAPSFQVRVGDKEMSVGLTVVALKQKGVLVTSVRSLRDGKVVGDERFFVLGPEPGETFDLEIDWDAAGTVTFLIRDKATLAANGFERHEAKLGSAPTEVEIVASTGEVSFDPLQLGQRTP